MEYSREEVSPMPAFSLNGISYVPHYQIENRYVSPGFGLTHWQTWSGLDLVSIGAKPVTEVL